MKMWNMVVNHIPQIKFGCDLLKERVCRYCHSKIDISNFDTKNPQFYYDKDKNNWICGKCISRCKKSKNENWIINTIKETEEKVNYINNEKYAKYIQEELLSWLENNYEQVTFDKFFFIKLAKIANGTYSKKYKPVSYSDMLDMWQRKKEWLDKMNTKNALMGKHIQGMNRVYYDLAILLNKYDSYLEWKKNNQIREEEVKARVSETKPEVTNYLNLMLKQKSNSSDEIDIVNLLNQIS